MAEKKPDKEKKLPQAPELSDAMKDELTLMAFPPAGGVYSVPNIQQFSSYINSLTKVYRNPDEAVRHSRENARAMRRSLVIMEPLRARQMAVAELTWHIEPEDTHDNAQMEVARQLTRIVEDIPDFLQFKMSLLEAVWFGRWANQIRYRWDFSTGSKRLVVGGWSPVHGDSLVYRWDSDKIGVNVIPYNIGEGTKDFAFDSYPTDVARSHILTDWEREAFVVHKHEVSAGDFFEPEAAGSIHGVGLRTYCYWSWHLMSEAHGWMTEYLERVGMGLTVYRFPAGNEQAEAAVREAARTQAFNNVILWPALPDQKWKDIERIEPASIGIESLMRVVQDYYGGLLRRMILGQSVAEFSGRHSGGGNSHTAFQQDAFRRLILYDATNLGDTMTRDLIEVLVKYNFPEYYGSVKFKFKCNVDKVDPDQYMRAAQAYYNLGGDLDADSLRSVIGLEKPTDDSQILRRAMTMMEEDDKGPGQLGEQGKDKEKGGKSGENSPFKVDQIREAINALGVNAKATEVIEWLKAKGIPVSRSLVYNTLQQLRGSTRGQPMRKQK